MVLGCMYMLMICSVFLFFFLIKILSLMIKNKIRAFLQDLKHWMTCNFLKLNESKTKVIQIFLTVILNPDKLVI